MSQTLDRAAVAERVPHRGANIITDTMTVSEDGQSSLSTTLVEHNDPHGREIFGRDDGAGGRCWQEPFLAELMALTGIPLLDTGGEDRVSVFSMISRMVFHDPVNLYRPVLGDARILRTRGAFTQFSCAVIQDGTTLMEGEVLSGTARLRDIGGGALCPLADAQAATPIEPFAWKAAPLTFAHRLVEADAEHLCAAYTYPDDHPFVATHFPGSPLMMGVTQWSAVADAAFLLAARLGVDRLQVDGVIRRPDGRDVVDVRDLGVETGPGGIPRLLGSKRVAFREVIRPGDGLLITVTRKS